MNTKNNFRRRSSNLDLESCLKVYIFPDDVVREVGFLDFKRIFFLQLEVLRHDFADIPAAVAENAEAGPSPEIG